VLHILHLVFKVDLREVTVRDLIVGVVEGSGIGYSRLAIKLGIEFCCCSSSGNGTLGIPIPL
jgi:hypothetical protein